MKYEVLSNEQWVEVSENIFWAYTGHRRIDGELYTGGKVIPLGGQTFSS